MKSYALFFMVFILLSACAPPGAATPSLTPLATAIPEPTQALEPTFTPIPAAEIPVDACAQLVDAKMTNVLEVVYAFGDAYPIKKSRFFFGSGTEHTGLALWSEDTQTSVPFPLPVDALGPELSSDHRWIVFRRDSGETQSELWAIDTKGQNEKQLAALSFDEIEARYPYLAGTFDAVLDYGWVSNTDRIYYSVVPIGGLGDPSTYDMFALVDVDSGQPIPLAKPLEVSHVIFAPHGRQAAILTESELRLISTQDGHVQFTLPMSLSSFGVEGSNSPAYSPDGKYVIDFVEEGIVRVNSEDGQWQIIPLKYSVFVPVGGDSPFARSPDFTWVGGSTMLLPILDSDQQYVVQPMEINPNWTFTVWRVDLADGTTQTIQTFTGYAPSVIFSPNGKLLAFHKILAAGRPPANELFLADLTTGEILETIEDGEFHAWSQDSDQYSYSTGHQPAKGETGDIKFYLGQIGKEAIP